MDYQSFYPIRSQRNDSPKSEWINIMLSYKEQRHTDTTELIKKMKYDTESNRALVNQFYERY